MNIIISNDSKIQKADHKVRYNPRTKKRSIAKLKLSQCDYFWCKAEFCTVG